MDERIFYFPEDLDFCCRICLEGYKVFYCLDVCIIHDAQEISSKGLFHKSAYRHLSGLFYFFSKYVYLLTTNTLRKKIKAKL